MQFEPLIDKLLILRHCPQTLQAMKYVCSSQMDTSVPAEVPPYRTISGGLFMNGIVWP